MNPPRDRYQPSGLLRLLATGRKLMRVTTPVHRPFMKIGRNNACPCGSGKKYKHCHLGHEAKDEPDTMEEKLAELASRC